MGDLSCTVSLLRMLHEQGLSDRSASEKCKKDSHEGERAAVFTDQFRDGIFSFFLAALLFHACDHLSIGFLF